ncbi:type IV secretion protein Rhs [Paenibacillus sp. GCM10027627]|uniref:type IV secretion protein Rhs n=1 Tax=unclassified Paenibacillus TaxID=185978 RepID=UPI00362987DC
MSSSKSGPTFASRKSTKNVVDEYGALSKNKNIPGQAHHLNQDAAYKKVIPTKKGVSSKLKGNAFKEIDSPHYNAHENMESFWNQYRRGGSNFGKTPTNLQYSKALVTSLKAAGKSKDEAMVLARAASKQRIKYGLLGGQEVPRIPGRVNQSKR